MSNSLKKEAAEIEALKKRVERTITMLKSKVDPAIGQCGCPCCNGLRQALKELEHFIKKRRTPFGAKRKRGHHGR